MQQCFRSNQCVLERRQMKITLIRLSYRITLYLSECCVYRYEYAVFKYFERHLNGFPMAKIKIGHPIWQHSDFAKSLQNLHKSSANVWHITSYLQGYIVHYVRLWTRWITAHHSGSNGPFEASGMGFLTARNTFRNFFICKYKSIAVI